MAGERREHTLQPTALVHEAYLRLVDMDVEWQDRAHFLAMAARTMRRLLIDHERSRRRKKRSGGIRVTLGDNVSTDAPEELGKQDEESARILELIDFGGLSAQEVGAVVGLSRTTVERRVRFAKAWLPRSLSGSSTAESDPGGPA
jgi:RNA polymerase sigma factor (TIGR02999 family)